MKIYQNTQYRPLSSIEEQKNTMYEKKFLKEHEEEHLYTSSDGPLCKIAPVETTKPEQLLHNSFRKLSMLHSQSSMSVHGVQKK